MSRTAELVSERVDVAIRFVQMGDSVESVLTKAVGKKEADRIAILLTTCADDLHADRKARGQPLGSGANPVWR